MSFEAIMGIGVYIIAFLFGITIGSFLNVCIYRLPKGESLVKRNSHCMSCGAEIKRYDLIPLFSWLALRGKCRSCGEKISPRYMLVEGLSGILFMLTYIQHDFIFDGIVYPALLCIFIAGLIVIGFEDFDTREMSVSVLVFLTGTAVATRILAYFLPKVIRAYDVVPLKECLIGMVIISVPFLIIGFIITPFVYTVFLSEAHKSARKIKGRMRKTERNTKEYARLEKELLKLETQIKEQGPVYGFGMGDIILMAAGGLMLGYKAALTAAFTAVITGALYAVIVLIRQKKDKKESRSFAFGPFLTVGLVFSTFYGTELYNLYVNSLLPE